MTSASTGRRAEETCWVRRNTSPFANWKSGTFCLLPFFFFLSKRAGDSFSAKSGGDFFFFFFFARQKSSLAKFLLDWSYWSWRWILLILCQRGCHHLRGRFRRVGCVSEPPHHLVQPFLIFFKFFFPKKCSVRGKKP